MIPQEPDLFDLKALAEQDSVCEENRLFPGRTSSDTARSTVTANLKAVIRSEATVLVRVEELLRLVSVAKMQQRAIARAAHSVTRPNVLDESKPRQSELLVHFLGSGSILVRGTYSGRSYFFSSERPDQALGSRDAQVLTKTGLFQLAY